MRQVERISSKQTCPSGEIAAYVDGELSAEAETALERHVGLCESCSRDLRDQRQFLAALTASLDDARSMRLPADFSRRVVANAESTVAGVRRPNELLAAVCIASALLLFSLFAFGGEAFTIASTAASVGQRILALGLFFLRLAGGFVFALAVISRSLASSFDPAVVIVSVGMFISAAIAFSAFRHPLRRRST